MPAMGYGIWGYLSTYPCPVPISWGEAGILTLLNYERTSLICVPSLVWPEHLVAAQCAAPALGQPRPF